LIRPPDYWIFEVRPLFFAGLAIVKIYCVIPILLLIFNGATAQLPPAEALHRSRQLQDAHHFEDAKTYAQIAVNGYLNSGQPDSLGEAYVMLWSSSWLAGLDYAGRIPILEKASRAFEQAGDSRRLADVLTDEAELCFLIDSTPAALHMALRAARLYQSVKYPRLQENYNVLSSIYTRLGDYNEAVHYGLLSVRTAAAVGDTSASVAAYNNHLAIAYTYLNQPDESEPYFRQGLSVALKYHDTGSVVQLSVNLANVLASSAQFEKSRKFLTGLLAAHPAYFARDSIMIGTRLLEIYNGLRQFKQGERYMKMLKKFIPHEEALYYLRTDAALRVSTYYMGQGELDSARHYLDYFANVAIKNKMTQAAFYVPYYRFQLDSLSGHYMEAIRQYERYKSASDSIQGATKYQQLAQYSALYESGQKDKSIQQLKHQADVQETRLRQEVFLRRVTIGGVALLLMLISLLYYAYRIKQRTNRLLESHGLEIAQKNLRLEGLVKEKEALVTEIHHRVKNNLYIISNLLESQSAYLQDEALFAVQTSKHRVEAISLIHQKLLLDGQLADVEMSGYLTDIVSSLREGIVTNEDIVFYMNLDPIQLDVTQAVSVGLIVNEAVTNAVKYAFPRCEETFDWQISRHVGSVTEEERASLHTAGRVDVIFKKGPTGEYFLRVADNGVGLPVDLNGGQCQTKSLGMSLIEGLSRALQARLRIHSGPGTMIEVLFS
jgi:two-component sensor histidine kinase